MAFFGRARLNANVISAVVRMTATDTATTFFWKQCHAQLAGAVLISIMFDVVYIADRDSTAATRAQFRLVSG